ncbi:MAG: hypothetical protein COA44_12055 [Arcobacter sp.]|nr:MAG: hypothetical protein COA44_12055 [Arcobacter sp.]
MNHKAIVYLEENEAWLFDGETFTPCDYSQAKKHQCGASISLSRLQVGSFKFPSSFSDSELEIQTEIKMHEEGSLYAEKNYEIASFNHALEFESSTLVESFAASHDELEDCCAKIVKKTRVIDWIVPSFITYTSFYIYNKLEAQTDLFYYLGKEESYAVLFHKGTYIAHRRILSIKDLAKDIEVDEQKCIYLLKNYGLEEESCPPEDKDFIIQLQTVFSKQVEKIIHTINHKRGLFGIEGINRIFIDFDGQSLNGLKNVFEAYGLEDLEVSALICKKDDVQNTHRFVKAMYIYLCANGEMPNALNISPYERQASWYKRHSGHLIATSVAALFLGLIHPSYFYIQGEIYDEKIGILETQLKIIEEKTKTLGTKLQTLKEEVDKSQLKLHAIKDKNKVYEVTLDTLPLLMNSRNIRQKMMYDALDILKTYKLSTVSLDQNGTTSMQIHVIADYHSRDKIAKFMKAWMDSGYKEATTQEIYLDKNIYESKIEVLR